MAPPTRPIFHDGQLLTAEELNSITAYCESRFKRLRAICLAAAALSWMAAAACAIAALRQSAADHRTQRSL